jgi:hypothetical protein
MLAQGCIEHVPVDVVLARALAMLRAQPEAHERKVNIQGRKRLP